MSDQALPKNPRVAQAFGPHREGAEAGFDRGPIDFLAVTAPEDKPRIALYAVPVPAGGEVSIGGVFVGWEDELEVGEAASTEP